MHICNRNQDGWIDREEFGDIMRATGEPLAEEDIDELMADADTNKDGKIDFDGKANVIYSIFMCCSHVANKGFKVIFS